MVKDRSIKKTSPFRGHQYPCFGLPVLSALGFKTGVELSRLCFVTYMEWMPQSHIWVEHKSANILVVSIAGRWSLFPPPRTQVKEFSDIFPMSFAQKKIRKKWCSFSSKSLQHTWTDSEPQLENCVWMCRGVPPKKLSFRFRISLSDMTNYKSADF